MISPTACGALFSVSPLAEPRGILVESSWNPRGNSGNLVESSWNPGGTLVEPWWNPRGTLPLRPQSFQLLGKTIFANCKEAGQNEQVSRWRAPSNCNNESTQMRWPKLSTHARAGHCNAIHREYESCVLLFSCILARSTKGELLHAPYAMPPIQQ